MGIAKVVELLGVVDDGTPAGPGVPINPRKPIAMTRGGSLTVRVTVVGRDGVMVTLTGASLLLTVKKKPSDYVPDISKTGVNYGGAYSEFALGPADTKNLEPGLYAYDVWLTKGGERTPVVPASPLWLEPSVANVP
jgi:hypothetical protein